MHHPAAKGGDLSVRDPRAVALTLSAVADRVGMKPSTIRRWIAQGRLHAIRTGTNSVRVLEADLAAYLASLPAAREKRAA